MVITDLKNKLSNPGVTTNKWPQHIPTYSMLVCVYTARDYPASIYSASDDPA